jgi:purine nucleosidase/ribosylpyrimidine nucleosidase
MTRRPLILDVDTGTDDAVAVMAAALHPDLDLIGVTTVNGNVPVENCTDNTLRVLDLIGRSDVAVHEGLARPIVRLGFPAAKRYERGSEKDMHGLTLPLPDPHSSKSPTSAVEYLVETLRAATTPVTLVPVGPLSNIAAALAVEPRITEAVDEVVIMGGGHDIGNETPSAEFNIWADPEAADMVFAAPWQKLTLVPLDATHRALVSRADCKAFEELGTPAGAAAARLIVQRIDAYAAGHAVAAEDAAPVHDALCVAYLLHPEVVTTRHLHVRVETQGTRTIGRTVIDTRTHDSEPPNAHVAFDADAGAFVQFLQSVLANHGTSAEAEQAR